MPKGKSNGSRRRTPPAGRSAAVAAPPEVLALVERFRANLESYRDPAYKEARLRREFLDPFFEALGWDLQNKAGHAEAYKDVVHEDAVKVGGSTEAPDYGFRVGGQRKFFVEAKKPSVAVGTDVHPAYQLRRYAWSAKLPLAILTDFEELAVYDCRVRPRRTDKSSTARILYMTYEEYPERWGEVAAIFSKDAVLKGSFDRFAEKGRRRGTATVDEAFLEEIEGWRANLARNLALRNPRLSVRDLNAAVQRTIDRIIFLRMCEDRGIEPGGALLGLVNGPLVYERLVALFERADDKYNSGLFHFRREPGRADPDELTPRLRVDDGVLADILRSLYYPESPYEFSVLGADILGQVYEQFLGKVIRLTAGHQAKVEEKPEVKKAGGVYYTPTYIVRYIVEETVGRLLPDIPLLPLPSVGEGGGEGGCEEKGTGVFCRNGPLGASHKILPSPFPASGPANARERGEVSRLRILDPACGSGSFLIGAFERLLDWHRDWYVADGTEKHPKEVYEGAGGQWRLTVREKRRILLNNIFGVDIDGQAVEVTKLSLLLKVLEGENQDTLERQMRLFHEERALPDLATNIKCGNSLIGPDFFDPSTRLGVALSLSPLDHARGDPECVEGSKGDGRQMNLFDEDEVHRVNAFDWEREFPAILGPKVTKKRRGFDAVIGNPPYIRMEGFKQLKDYLKSRYTCHDERSDLYAYFAERAHRLLAPHGRFGMILSNKFLRANYGRRLRAFLVLDAAVERIVDLAGLPVFPGATVRTLVLLSARDGGRKGCVCYTPPLAPEDFAAVAGGTVALKEAAGRGAFSVEASALGAGSWHFAPPAASDLMRKLKEGSQPLVDYCGGKVCMGIKSGLGEAFVVDEVGKARILKANPKAREIIKQFLNGRDVRRYAVHSPGEYLLYTYHGVPIDCYPAVKAHLEPFRARLKARATRQQWYELQQPQYAYAELLDGPKIVFPDIAKRPRFALDEEGHYGANTVYFIPGRDLYLLGLLNSRLAHFYFKATCAGLEGKTETYLRFFGQYLEGFPVRAIGGNADEAKDLRDRMIQRVERMLDLKGRLAKARSVEARGRIQRLIDRTDREIDALVYKLYGLTEEDIGIVEEGTG